MIFDRQTALPPFWAAALLVLGGGISHAQTPAPDQIVARQKTPFGGASRYESVALDPPATVRIVPLDDKPLERGQPMQFAVRMEGAPKPINMFSLRVEYTSGTLDYVNFVQGPGYLVDVTLPYSGPDGAATLNIAGISLTGAKEGELVRLEFLVPQSAPDSIKIALGDHPLLGQKLCHDDEQTTYDYARRFDATRTAALSVVTPAAGAPARTFERPAKRVIKAPPRTAPMGS